MADFGPVYTAHLQGSAHLQPDPRPTHELTLKPELLLPAKCTHFPLLLPLLARPSVGEHRAPLATERPAPCPVTMAQAMPTEEF